MNKNVLRKYFIMGSQDCPKNRTPEATLREAIQGGITIYQFREKGRGSLQGEEKIALGKALRAICKEANIPFIINNDIELMDVLQADGIHVGQSDEPVKKIREKYPHKWIGLSISNMEQYEKSSLAYIDYIGAGPVFSTTSKSDALQPVGIEWIQTLRKLTPHIPIVGIGGISPDNALHVLHAGADGVSVISAITKAENIQKAVRSL
ncbi:MAG TPA: thiamine phosphate synthase [Candidatus Pseudogracilibacillus intestinigallinarum]|uniref:Thiamine-phosphate synthase n=1 Tax=Candidatus Pseudogracilibacillus intestinigallinarum TaxID=2838742 RepID=A0A9D1TJX8_9BACI|nr:thiamine phosphate synthase [Candidatus Pseudogracilibacillus intestinigallinarum]